MARSLRPLPAPLLNPVPQNILDSLLLDPPLGGDQARREPRVETFSRKDALLDEVLRGRAVEEGAVEFDLLFLAHDDRVLV